MREITIGIIGGGVVGGAVKNFFRSAKVYDKFKKFDTIEEAGAARFIFVTVPTPFTDRLDLSMVDDAVANVVSHLTKAENQLIVIKSTVLPGSTQAYQDRYPHANFVFSPEFLRDKTANEDFIKNDRQIMGCTSKTKNNPLVEELMSILPPAPYQKIVPSQDAELIKYAGNTFLALQVIFANEIYDMCEAAGVDYELVKEAVKSDKRVGKTHWEIFHTESSLQSTVAEKYRGYGGKCFPKDINSLIFEGNKLGVDMSLFESGRAANLQLNGGKYDQ
jgi:UDPglucose 6-dehydrogenase